MAKQYSAKEKLYWVKKYLASEDKLAIRDEMIAKYPDRYINNADVRKWVHARLKKWVTKYNLGMSNLISKTGKNSTGRKSKDWLEKKKGHLTDLDDHDLKIYEEVVDALLRKRGLTKEDVMEELLKRKNDVKNKKGMSDVFGINRKVFYREKVGRKYRIVDPIISKKIEEKWEEFYKIYGYQKLHTILLEDKDFKASLWEVRKCYESLGLRSIRFEKFSNKPKEAKDTSVKGPNLIGEEYIGTQPNHKWFTDVSYIRLKSGRWVYLSLIIDSFANKVLHWELGFLNDTNLAYVTLVNAIKKYGIPQIIHTDHGSPYVSREFTKLCNKLGIQKSLSGIGKSLDNRPVEFVFGLIKHEYLLHQELDSYEDVQKELNTYISFYNEKRIQSNLENMSPDKYLRTYC